ncbi:phosphoribosylglycinamide formyltransferase [Thermus filiformis]|nr:phosphoribosylglycinamide formyltransferase [Thermus filiformis]
MGPEPFPLGRPARMAVFASGRGTNLQALLDAFPPGHPLGEVALVVSDREEAFALERARARGVEAVHLPWRKGRFAEEAQALLKARGIDLVLLAGFMRILPAPFVEAWYGRLLNIHPSLLPDYPGLHVHERVLAAREAFSGTTVHFVDQGVDTGPLLLQARVPVLPTDTPEALEARVLSVEHRAYPLAVRLLLLGLAGPEPLSLVLRRIWPEVPYRSRPYYLRAERALRAWGRSVEEVGFATDWARAAFLFAYRVEEELAGGVRYAVPLPRELEERVEALLGRVNSRA